MITIGGSITFGLLDCNPNGAGGGSGGTTYDANGGNCKDSVTVTGTPDPNPDPNPSGSNTGGGPSNSGGQQTGGPGGQSGGASPTNGLPKPTPLRATIPGTNYCGPGGSGTPTDQADAACAAHDLCYQNAGVSFLNNLGWPKTAQQSSAIRACDAQLCVSLSRMAWPTSSEVGQATLVSTFFGCSGGYSQWP
jgi:hypothetical protein